MRERMRSGEGRRIGKYGTSAVAQALIVLAIVGALGFLATRYHEKWDASEARVHSISDQTQKLLAGLEQDVQVVAFYPKLDQANARALLDKYQYASPRVKVEYADPNARPDLVERYAVTPEKLGEGLLFVKIGEESVQIEQADEEKLTNAIVKLTRPIAQEGLLRHGSQRARGGGQGRRRQGRLRAGRRRAAQRELSLRDAPARDEGGRARRRGRRDRRGPDADRSGPATPTSCSATSSAAAR